LKLGSSKITNFETSVTAFDAATEAYADTKFRSAGGIISGAVAINSGGLTIKKMTGIILTAVPSAAQIGY